MPAKSIMQYVVSECGHRDRPADAITAAPDRHGNSKAALLRASGGHHLFAAAGGVDLEEVEFPGATFDSSVIGKSAGPARNPFSSSWPSDERRIRSRTNATQAPKTRDKIMTIFDMETG
jgi:hypothetical protein